MISHRPISAAPISPQWSPVTYEAPAISARVLMGGMISAAPISVVMISAPQVVAPAVVSAAVWAGGMVGAHPVAAFMISGQETPRVIVEPPVVAPLEMARRGGGTTRQRHTWLRAQADHRRRLEREDEELVAAVAHLIASGALNRWAA